MYLHSYTAYPLKENAVMQAKMLKWGNSLAGPVALPKPCLIAVVAGDVFQEIFV